MSANSDYGTWREVRQSTPIAELRSRSALVYAVGRALERLAEGAFVEHLESVDWRSVEMEARMVGDQLQVIVGGPCQPTDMHRVWVHPQYLDADPNDDPCEPYVPYLRYDEALADWVEGDQMWTRIQGRWTEVER